MKLFLFAERQIAFVQYSSVIISFIFSKTKNDGCRYGLPQLKRFHANDLHIFDFHVSEFPTKNVRFLIDILETYTQKYYFRPLRQVNAQKHGLEANYNIACARAKADKTTLFFLKLT